MFHSNMPDAQVITYVLHNRALHEQVDKENCNVQNLKDFYTRFHWYELIGHVFLDLCYISSLQHYLYPDIPL